MKTIVAAQCVAALAALGGAQPVAAQSWDIDIHGHTVSCTASNGQVVPIYTDPAAAHAAAPLGGARVDLTPQGYQMGLNLPMLSNAAPRAAMFVFMHECGHAALPMGVGLNAPDQEQNADCWAMQQMVALGYVQEPADFVEDVSYIVQIGGWGQQTRNRINALWGCT